MGKFCTPDKDYEKNVKKVLDGLKVIFPQISRWKRLNSDDFYNSIEENFKK